MSTPDDWKTAIEKTLFDFETQKESTDDISLTAMLAGKALWPLIQAGQRGDKGPFTKIQEVEKRINAQSLFRSYIGWLREVSSEKETIDVISRDINQDNTLKEEIAAFLKEDKMAVHLANLEEETIVRLLDILSEEANTTLSPDEIKTAIEVRQNSGEIIGVQNLIEQIFVNVQPRINIPVNDYRNTYLENLKRDCLKLQLTRLGGITSSLRQKSLAEVYISLNTEAKVKPDGEVVMGSGEFNKEMSKKEENDLEDLSVFAATIKHDLLVIKGGPGSGKSTFVKYFIAGVCDHLQNNSEAEGPLPVLVALRSLSDRIREKDTSIIGGEDELINEILAEIEKDLERKYDALPFKDELVLSIKKGNAILAFDGMDEVPVDERGLMKRAILHIVNRFGAKKVIVTCRVRSYHGEVVFEDWPAYLIAELNQFHKDVFARKWYEDSEQDKREAKRKAENLVDALQTPEIAEIAKTPLLITILSILHEQGGTLPEQRVHLYHKAIEILLNSWEAHKYESPGNLTDEELTTFIKSSARVLPVLQELAFKALDTGKDNKEQTAYLETWEALKFLREILSNTAQAEDFLNYMDTRAGLLRGEGDDRYSFAHRTYQEYLAACHLLTFELDKIVSQLRMFSEDEEYWRVVIELACEELYHDKKGRGIGQLLNMHSLAFQGDVKEEFVARLCLWAGYASQLVGKDTIISTNVLPAGGNEFLARVRKGLKDCLISPLTIQERVDAGQYLSELGDTREDLLKSEKMEFCLVPAGPFLMGSTNEEVRSINNSQGIDYYKNELPRHKIDLDYEYWIGRYPVTVSQFNEFTNSGGYNSPFFWSSAGWDWQKANSKSGPRQFDDIQYLENQPVVGISWYEAHAFSNWYGDKLKKSGLLNGKWQVSLPSEAEWEKAARGGLEVPKKIIIGSPGHFHKNGSLREKNRLPGRRYPWGNQLEVEYSNNAELQLHGPSTPGCFKMDFSVYGVEGLAGNVSDWTRSKYEDYPYKIDGKRREKRENLQGSSPRVWRGGAFTLNELYCRSSFRVSNFPNYQRKFLGFRLVLHPTL